MQAAAVRVWNCRNSVQQPPAAFYASRSWGGGGTRDETGTGRADNRPGKKRRVRSSPAHGIGSMEPNSMGDSSETDDLLRRAADGDRDAVAALLARHRDRLEQMVRLRIDRRLQGRIDPSD